ncbi:MAG TPA: hypothetical protein VFZ65_12505 [Planctomycetota bacterium]|nr:hypothetical protein [Planctomycetota bacterium]
MSVRLFLSLTVSALAWCAGTAPAQEPKPIAYPDRDLLSPFRNPGEVYAPPDELFRLLREMEAIANDPNSIKKFDEEGREIVDSARWRLARAEVDRIGVNAAILAQIMRTHKNANDRATAFYAMTFAPSPVDVFNLISHIPGEPERRTRELAMPRAIAYLRAHLGRRFGDLTEDQKNAIVSAMPKIGSPMARSAGIVRAPRDEDTLFELRLVPFFQLLDQDDPLDQAQALWFLKETFLVRLDLALKWLEPSLPRVRQLLASDDDKVKEQAIGLFQVIGPKDLQKPPTDGSSLQVWADEACKALFPPIRNLNDTIIQIQPSPERDALIEAATKALETSSIGDPYLAQAKDGTWRRGFRVARVPDELKVLAIPAESIITTVNGVGVSNAKTLLQAVRDQLRLQGHPRKLFVEYLLGDAPRAVEYRIL